MAESEENAAASPESPAEPAAVPARAGHGEEEPPADPLAALAPAGRELLDVSLEVLKEFDDRPVCAPRTDPVVCFGARIVSTDQE